MERIEITPKTPEEHFDVIVSNSQIAKQALGILLNNEPQTGDKLALRLRYLISEQEKWRPNKLTTLVLSYLRHSLIPAGIAIEQDNKFIASYNCRKYYQPVIAGNLIRSYLDSEQRLPYLMAALGRTGTRGANSAPIVRSKILMSLTQIEGEVSIQELLKIVDLKRLTSRSLTENIHNLQEAKLVDYRSIAPSKGNRFVYRVVDNEAIFNEEESIDIVPKIDWHVRQDKVNRILSEIKLQADIGAGEIIEKSGTSKRDTDNALWLLMELGKIECITVYGSETDVNVGSKISINEKGKRLANELSIMLDTLKDDKILNLSGKDYHKLIFDMSFLKKVVSHLIST